MRLPKITKYSVAVTAAGTSVWPQMRMMRPYSRMMMVLKPTHRCAASDSSMRTAPVLDQAHEHFLEPVHLVAHGKHLDALRGELGEQLILSLIHISEPTRRTPISYAVFC